MRRSLAILGVNFNDQPFGEALAQLGRALASEARRTVFFANAATLNLASADPDYRAILNSADHLYGDGTGVRWAARLRGVKLKSNLNGTDLIPALVAATPGIRVFMLGSRPDDIEEAARRFPVLFPNAVLAGWSHGYFDHRDSDRVIADINAAKPDILLVGFGNPLQERWLLANRAAIEAPLAAAIGGLFDFWSGRRRRAPKWLRAMGHEWLHILLTERHKARRYIVGNPLFLLRMVTWLGFDRAMQAHSAPGDDGPGVVSSPPRTA